MAGIKVINNFVNIPDESKICKQENDNIILFLGKMDYEPNQTAVSFFADSIFPKLKSLYSNLEFRVIGARPSARILSLNKREGIRIMGFVESTEPYFQSSSIVIAPMLSGAGVQNKIIQAMAYGCCVATTNIGAEGLYLQGDDIAIFNGVSEWITGLSKLLSNRNTRLEYGAKARNTVQNTLAKEIVFNQFCELFDMIQYK